MWFDSASSTEQHNCHIISLFLSKVAAMYVSPRHLQSGMYALYANEAVKVSLISFAQGCLVAPDFSGSVGEAQDLKHEKNVMIKGVRTSCAKCRSKISQTTLKMSRIRTRRNVLAGTSLAKVIDADDTKHRTWSTA